MFGKSEKALFPLVRPDVPKLHTWQREIKSAYRLGMYSNGGINWKTLNSMTESYFPGSKAVGVANNTVGQIASLQALNVRNNLVFLSNFTFPATLLAVLQAGGIPVICDTDPITWELSIESIKAGIQEFGKPKVVLHTRVFGKREDLSPINSFLGTEGIDLLLDSAAAFPSSREENSNLNEVFSLHATKALGIGEGGIIVGEESFIEETWSRCNFGYQNGNKFLDGSNAKMDEFAAARAIAGLKKYKEVCQKRRLFVNSTYNAFYSNSNVQVLRNNMNSIWSLFPVKFNSEDHLLKFSEISMKLGLFGKRYYAPSILDGYKGEYEVHRVSNLDESQKASKLIYCLPVYSKYSKNESYRIKEITLNALEVALN